MKQREHSSGRLRLVVVDGQQFGYLTDSFQYCRYLSEEFDVTYVGWDYGHDPIRVAGVRVVDVSRDGGKITRLSRLIRAQLRVIREASTDVVLAVHYPGCFLLPLLGRARRFVLDIRTGAVEGGEVRRYVTNLLLRLEATVFPHVIILSESLRQLLRLNPRKCHLVPLGAEVPALPDKDFASMRLFYVGVLDGRHIDRTVEGFARFYAEFKDKVEASYDIVGYSLEKDTLPRLKQAIRSSAAEDRITYHGRVPYTQLAPFLERNNVGVAFIPRYSHYEVQPATKLFEYALAGMAVIATSTLENTRVMSPEIGIVIEDTAEGFYEGLKRMLGMLSAYNSRTIKQSLAQYSWENIVRRNLAVYLRTILQVDDITHTSSYDLATQRTKK
jgi:glycosyltransferase involved in cell wall biosynthesis